MVFLVAVKYMTITLFLVALSLIINVLLLSMHQRGPLDDNVPLPPWARDLFLHKLAYLVGMSSYITSDDEHAAMVAQVAYLTWYIINIPIRGSAKIIPPPNPRILWKWVGGSRSHSEFFV